jgi:signal transduction histidine kinase
MLAGVRITGASNPARTVRWLLGDLLLAAALIAMGILATPDDELRGAVPDRPVETLAYAVVIANGLVLAVRRRWPLATLIATSVFTSVYLAVGYPYGPIFFPFAVAVYTAARHRPLTRALPAAIGALLILLIHLLTNGLALDGFLGLIPGSAWVAVPFAVGTTVRVSREVAERNRAEAIRQRVEDERLSVAQEVHDVVGHGLAAIKVQSDVALHVMSNKPEQAAAALRAISSASSEALAELRTTLTAVRRVGNDLTRAPIPGLARLNDIQQRMRAAGVRVNVETVGDPRQLPAVIDLTGYRIVQESLTNVLKHSVDKLATVRLEYQSDALLITVTNPAAPVPSIGDGLGVRGMRRRVAALGGQFHAGPTGDGRFEVHAILPIGGDR